MTRIADLPAHRQALAWSIISDADLPEDTLLREGDHDFTEGIRWGLSLTLASARGITLDEAMEILR